MAKKGKAKISKVKRNNQTTNKMKKQGQLRLQRHRTKVQKQKLPSQPQVEYSSASDSESGEEWADMLDEEEKNYILSRINKQPQLLANVPEKDEKNNSRKRKKDNKEKMPKEKKPKVSDSKIAADTDSDTLSEGSESEVEEKYEQEMADKPVKRTRPLLPIKTRQGLEEREEEVEDTDSDDDNDDTKDSNMDSNQLDSGSDSGIEGTEEESETPHEETPEEEKVVTSAELLAARRDKLQHEKLRIGALCSSLLEDPEKKIKNFYPILYLMEERLKDGTLNLHSVRKLATISICEVFKDILPDYHLRHQDYSNVKLKKDTLSLYKYEKELLEFYKRYLQRLEKATNALRPKKGDNRKLDEATSSLALVSLRCMCALLVARPNFNYATNVAQSVVPLLDCKIEAAREIVTAACVDVFTQDSRGDITLAIVRLINQLARRRGERLRPGALACLLSLRIKDVDLDAETDLKHKKKQEEKHKKRIVNLSKKEKKRAKKLKEVERELLETEAQESDVARKKLLTEVTKTVFHIYFRLLKAAPGSNLLSAALDGLAKFTHVINLEFYSDLVAILRRLLGEHSASARERLRIVRCVLAVLAGAGDALNVDPAVFHTQLYVDMMEVHAGHTESLSPLLLECLYSLTARARRVGSRALLAFGKRLLALAAQGSPATALAALSLLRTLTQQNKALSSLFDLEAETTGTRYQPLLGSAEHCGAEAAIATELCVLMKHHNASVRLAASGLLGGTWPQSLHKLTPMSIYEMYDGSQMAFKPAIPPPPPVKATRLKPTHFWSQASLQQLCESVENNVDLTFEETIVR